jgi:hypothetical protein
MSWLSSFVSHNAGWLAPVASAIPFVGPTIAHQIDATNAAGQTAAASQAAAQAAAAQANATALAQNALAVQQASSQAAQNAIITSSPAATMTLWYVGGGILLLLVLYLSLRKR